MTTNNGPGTLVVDVPADLCNHIGATVGPTPPQLISASQVETFRKSCGEDTLCEIPDNQIPPLMLVSVVNLFLPQLVSVTSFSMGVNVGLDGASFDAPATVGHEYAATGLVASAVELKGGIQVQVDVSIAPWTAHLGIDPNTAVCVAHTVSRFFP